MPLALLCLAALGPPRTQSPPARGSVTAFVHVAVIPMDRERLLEDQTVLVRDGRIQTLGSASKVKVPAGTVRIDGRGRFLIPGMGDMHTHMRATGTNLSPDDSAGWAQAIAATDDYLTLLAAEGITTVRNMDYILTDGVPLRARARAAQGTHPFPRVFTSGGWNLLGAKQPGAIAASIHRYKQAGYDFVKVHDDTGAAFTDSLFAAARREGLPVVGHLPGGYPSYVAALEHVLALRAYQGLEHLMGYTSYLWPERLGDTAIADASSAGASLAGADVRRALAATRTIVAETKAAGVWICPTQWMGMPKRIVKLLHDAGIGILMGTDRMNDFLGGQTAVAVGLTAYELQALVDAGLTPYEALETATRNVAAYFGTLGSAGTIAAGKRADLVLLRDNPLRAIGNVDRPVGVMLGGRWYAREELERTLMAAGLELRSIYHAP